MILAIVFVMGSPETPRYCVVFGRVRMHRPSGFGRAKFNQNFFFLKIGLNFFFFKLIDIFFSISKLNYALREIFSESCQIKPSLDCNSDWFDTKRNYVWWQIIRKSVISIQIWFELTKFSKVSPCTSKWIIRNIFFVDYI